MGDSLRIGSQQLDKLFMFALIYDQQSADELLMLVIKGVRMLDSLFDSRPEIVKKSAIGKLVYPVLHTKRKRVIDKQRRVLDSLQLAEGYPFRETVVRQDDVYYGIVDWIFPAIERIRKGGESPEGMPTKFNAIPPLAAASVPLWVEAGTWYFTRAEFLPVLRAPGTWFHQMANPSRGAGKRANKAKARIPDVDANTDFIQETKIQQRTKKIALIVATDADLTWGFKETLQGRLRRMVRR